MFEKQIDETRVRRLIADAKYDSIAEGATFWEEHIFENGDESDNQHYISPDARTIPLFPQLDLLITTFENRVFNDRKVVLFYELTRHEFVLIPHMLPLVERISVHHEAEFFTLRFTPNRENPEDHGEAYLIAVAFTDSSRATPFTLQFGGQSKQQVIEILDTLEGTA